MNRRRQGGTTLAAVRKSLESQIVQMRGPEGRPHAAYAAFSHARVPVGFVWIIEAQSGLTGTSYAWVMCIYVDEEARGKGLGRMLMAQAEVWARARDLEEIVLNVAAWQDAARRLYEAEGYRVETLNYRKHLR
jgi:ribosomal protein S18 acetylase RimI-like enzyme